LIVWTNVFAYFAHHDDMLELYFWFDYYGYTGGSQMSRRILEWKALFKKEKFINKEIFHWHFLTNNVKSDNAIPFFQRNIDIFVGCFIKVLFKKKYYKIYLVRNKARVGDGDH